ncbi:hypothetical protein ABI59_23905 [Acidobacteria bacterium Mor1]|nr:hypothetical protein ABI59_23905 [Acidobacteria bacterium Mor1]
MRVVGIDTSSWWGSLALVEAEEGEPLRTVADVGLAVRKSHTSHLLALLETLLEHAGWSKSSIDGYAASRGPGSFTGVRVGLGTVRGLALAADRPALGVVTLEAMAESMGPAEIDRVPMLDAGRGEVYFGRYDAASCPPREIEPPTVASADAAWAGGAGVYFGPGADVYADRCPGRVARSPRRVAEGVSRLALLKLRQGAVDAEGLSPLYLRPPDAELKKKKRR